MAQDKVFVIMSNDEESDKLYGFINGLLKKEFSFHVARADALLHRENLLQNMVESIHDSDIIVADLTKLDPCVFYELGVAHALKKKVIYLAQDLNTLAFEPSSHRVIQYGVESSDLKDLEGKLRLILTEPKGGEVSYFYDNMAPSDPGCN